MASSGHTFLRIKATGDSKKDYVVANVLVSPTLKEDALISYNDLRRLRVIDEDFPRRRHHHNNNNNQNIEPSVYRTHVDKLNEIADKYPDVFDSEKLAPLKVPPMEINVNRQHPDYKPLRIYTARKTPLHFEDNADELLKYLLDTGVIKRADPNRQFEWVSPAFFVPKRSGKARLVIDFSRLSKFAVRTPHPFPSPRDVIRSIKPNSRWFLTSDMRNGYFQLSLSEEATNYTAFLLPQGLFVMCRGPQGLSPTSDNFVPATDHILEGLDLVKIIDDTLIQGETPEECLEKFELLCERARQFGLTLTREKLLLAQEVTFAGWVIGKDGIKSEPYKLAALSEFPTPKNLRDLRSFCGAITQLNMLSPDIAHAIAGLHATNTESDDNCDVPPPLTPETSDSESDEEDEMRSSYNGLRRLRVIDKDFPRRGHVSCNKFLTVWISNLLVSCHSLFSQSGINSSASTATVWNLNQSNLGDLPATTPATEELLISFHKLDFPTQEQLITMAAHYRNSNNGHGYYAWAEDNGDYASLLKDASANCTNSNGRPRLGNYVRNHFQKLEAEGKCIRCAVPVEPQDREEHKSSCKARGARCAFCVSKNMGPKAGGHLEAACAKKLRAKVPRAAAESNADIDVPTRDGPLTPICCRRERVRTYKAIATLLLEEWDEAYKQADISVLPLSNTTTLSSPPTTPTTGSLPTTPWMTPSSS